MTFPENSVKMKWCTLKKSIIKKNMEKKHKIFTKQEKKKLN